MEENRQPAEKILEYEAVYEAARNGQKLYEFRGGHSNGISHLELNAEDHSLRLEWPDEDPLAAPTQTDELAPIPVRATLDEETVVDLELRNNKLVEPGSDGEWQLPPSFVAWEGLFGMPPGIQPLTDDPFPTDPGSWAKCVAPFTGVGAGIGAAVGLFTGPGLPVSTAMGSAIGTSFGVGYCTTGAVVQHYNPPAPPPAPPPFSSP